MREDGSFQSEADWEVWAENGSCLANPEMLLSRVCTIKKRLIRNILGDKWSNECANLKTPFFESFMRRIRAGLFPVGMGGESRVLCALSP